MRKDKSWLLEKHRECIQSPKTEEKMFDLGYELALDDMFIYINQLDESEKPVLPQFVADWIDAHNLHGNNPLREYRDLENDFNEGWTNEEDAAVYHWINKNPYAFIDALRYGCKVEKVKIYYIYDKSTKGYLGYNADKTRLSWYTSQFPNDVFTEQEIKEIDERYWAFAQEVTE